MNVSTALIARALNTLENKKYKKRESDKTDARKVVIRLTELGGRALEKRKKVVADMLEPMLNNLSDEEKTLFSLMKSCCNKGG